MACPKCMGSLIERKNLYQGGLRIWYDVCVCGFIYNLDAIPTDVLSKVKVKEIVLRYERNYRKDLEIKDIE